MIQRLLALLAAASVVVAMGVLFMVAISGCVTARPDTPTCRDAVRTIMREMGAAGFRMVQAQPQPTGELASFTDGTTVRFEYIAYDAAVADYMATRGGWSRRTTCLSPDGDTHHVLEREALVPRKPEAPVEETRAPVVGEVRK